LGQNKWRTRLQPIRTIAEVPAHIKIQPAQRIYLYQKLAQNASELRLLGMTYKQIAKALKIGKNTARKACQFKRR
jgi:DNA-binding CsgD family transcriptional regulator